MSAAEHGDAGARAGSTAPSPSRDDRAVGIWLLVCCALVFAMAVIGAITRLTESGLSIMEWAPVSGALPPFSREEWERLFALYRTIPEYQEINQGMSLEDFRRIFWWEYVHRLWGRMIGFVFLLPLLWFWLRHRLRPSLARHLWGIFALGALQGLMGWYMVASGFAERTDVSQYRLAAHLLLACAIYAYSLWIALGLLAPPAAGAAPGPAGLRRAAAALGLLVAITLASGAFVAGLDAGLVYNSFPLMGERLLPADYALLSPWSANHFENPATVQFNHRALAVTTLAAALALGFAARFGALGARARGAFALLALAAALQVGLGIATLLLVVPVWLGALHQAGALVLLTAVVWALHALRPGPA